MLPPHRCGYEVNVLLGEALVPRQHQHVPQALEDAGKARGRVIDGFGSRQGEGKATSAERPLVAKNLALESRLWM